MNKLSIIFFAFYLLIPEMGIKAQHINSYPDIDYQGKRAFIQKLKLGSPKKNGQSFQAVLINTGKSPITEKDFQERLVLIKTNPSVQEVLSNYSLGDLYQALGAKKLKLAPGVTNEKYSGLIIKGAATSLTTEPVVSTESISEETTTVVVVDKEENTPVEIKDKEVKKKKISKKKARKAIENNEAVIKNAPEEIVEATSPVEIPEEKKESIEKSNPIIAEAVPEIAEEKVLPPAATEEPAISKEEQSLLENSNTSIDSEASSYEEACSDLQIKKIKIVRKTKNSVTLAYTIINLGQADALLKGLDKNDENVALRAHLCSSNKLTRGAITLGGSFLKISDEHAVLQSGESFSGELKLPLYKLTKFTPYLVLQADPYQKIIECDETNNINFINLIPAEVSASENN